jgi:hypothetical protein
VTALPGGPTVAVEVDLTGPVPQSNAVLAMGNGSKLPVADLLCGTGLTRAMAMREVEHLARERAAAGQFPAVDAYLQNLRDLFAALDAHARGTLQ